MPIDTGGTVLLSGVVGSTAYGLAGPGSDVDRLGVFAAPTAHLLGLTQPRDTYTSTKPDVTMHELSKWCCLALKSNPNAIELVWLESYDTVHPIGWELLQLRRSFLSEPCVRAAYLGYAHGQLKKITDGVGGQPRAAKHARHMYRLLHQGLGLLRDGRLSVRLQADEADRCRRFGDAVGAGLTTAAQRMLDEYQRQYAGVVRTALPDRPDTEAINGWLLSVRRRLLDPDMVIAGECCAAR